MKRRELVAWILLAIVSIWLGTYLIEDMRAQSFDAKLKKISAEAKEQTERINEESDRRRQTWTQEQWDASARQREKDARCPLRSAAGILASGPWRHRDSNGGSQYPPVLRCFLNVQNRIGPVALVRQPPEADCDICLSFMNEENLVGVQDRVIQ
jgi:hypothetical protein